MKNYSFVILHILILIHIIGTYLPIDTLNQAHPFQVEVINYVYYLDNIPLTNPNGTTANINDYLTSNKVSLTVLLVIEGLTSRSQMNFIQTGLSNPAFAVSLNQAIQVTYKHAPAQGTITTSLLPFTNYNAEPIIPTAESNNANSMNNSQMRNIWILIGLLSFIMTIWM